MRELGIKSRMQKRYRKPKTVATVLDPEKRKVLGYKIGDTMTAELATSALQMALDKHRKQLIVHS
ncbi:transposase, partial [Leuconostoc mesenteroides subsp. mesenteroides]